MVVDESSLARERRKRDIIEMIGFFSLGFTNNFHYMMVIVACQNIVSSFEYSNLISIFFLVLTISGLLSQFINILFVSSIKEYHHRMTIVVILDVIGMIGLMISALIDVGHFFGFMLTLVAVSFISGSSCIGESVSISYMQFFNESCLSMWHLGFGICSITSSILYISSIYAGMKHIHIAIIISVTTPIHTLVFYCILEKMRTSMGPQLQQPTFVLIDKENDPDYADSSKVDARDFSDEESDANMLMIPNKPGKINDIINTLKHMCWYIPNTLFVCYLEEVILIGFATDPFLPEDYKYWIVRNSFTLFATCYSIGGMVGAFISMSFSLDTMRNKMWLLTFIQIGNLFFWFFQWRYKFLCLLFGTILSFVIQFFSMCFVGLLFSLSYITSFNQMKRVFLERRPFTGSEKYCEMAINVTTTGMSSISIVSSFTFFIITNVIFVKQ
jgi:hypothetical protein